MSGKFRFGRRKVIRISLINTRLSLRLLAGIFAGWRAAPNSPELAEITVKSCGWFDLTHLRLPLPGLAPAFHGYRLAQISDLHLDGSASQRRLAEVVACVNHEAPDLVAVTGDFVTDQPARHRRALVETLQALEPSGPALAVLGNHDHWSDPEVVRQILAECGLVNVSNSVYTVRRGDSLLHVAGIDDFMNKQDRLDLVLERLPTEGAAILLAHEPDFADISAAAGRFSLQLSGHSHGGQINLPILGPPFLPGHAHKYPAGLYRVGNLLLYTNRGIGNAHFPVRINARPEVTVVTLTQVQTQSETLAHS